MLLAFYLFEWALNLTPRDTPEWQVLAKAACDMPEACKNGETYKQFKERTCPKH